MELFNSLLTNCQSKNLYFCVIDQQIANNPKLTNELKPEISQPVKMQQSCNRKSLQQKNKIQSRKTSNRIGKKQKMSLQQIPEQQFNQQEKTVFIKQIEQPQKLYRIIHTIHCKVIKRYYQFFIRIQESQKKQNMVYSQQNCSLRIQDVKISPPLSVTRLKALKLAQNLQQKSIHDNIQLSIVEKKPLQSIYLYPINRPLQMTDGSDNINVFLDINFRSQDTPTKDDFSSTKKKAKTTKNLEIKLEKSYAKAATPKKQKLQNHNQGNKVSIKLSSNKKSTKKGLFEKNINRKLLNEVQNNKIEHILNESAGENFLDKQNNKIEQNQLQGKISEIFKDYSDLKNSKKQLLEKFIENFDISFDTIVQYNQQRTKEEQQELAQTILTNKKIVNISTNRTIENSEKYITGKKSRSSSLCQFNKKLNSTSKVAASNLKQQLYAVQFKSSSKMASKGKKLHFDKKCLKLKEAHKNENLKVKPKFIHQRSISNVELKGKKEIELKSYRKINKPHTSQINLEKATPLTLRQQFDKIFIKA